MQAVSPIDAIDADTLRRAAREEADKIVVRRVGIATAIVTLVLPAYAVLDRVLGQPNVAALDAIKLVVGVVPPLCLLFLWTPRGRAHARPVTFGLVVLMTITSGASAVISENFVAHDMLAVMATLFTGALIPWGLAYQLATIGILAISALVVTASVAGSLAPLLGYPTMVALTTWVTSIYVGREIMATIHALTEQNLQRGLAQQRLEEEARVSAALARAGRELIACTERPALLKRLCELATELTPCDCSWTIVRNANDADYHIGAHHGVPDAALEPISLVPIPASEFQGLGTALRGGHVIRTGPGSSATLSRLREQLGLDTRMYAPLWQGDELRGALAAAFRTVDARFSVQQERLLIGLGQLASLALETNRLIEELERVSRFKSDFVASMSHELRTPLNVILGYHDLLLDGAFGALTKDQLNILGRTEKNARELLDLINATLDLSRLDSRGPELDLRDVRPQDLLNELREELRIGLENPQLQVTWEADPQLPLIYTDRLKLRMVLKNLVHNALKFTPCGSVRVEASRQGDRVVFTVADTGVGVAAEQRDKIFEAFHQVEPGTGTGGVGLGLYIVRRLVDAMGGVVEIESELGVGSTFRVCLPSTTVPGTARGTAVG